MQAKTQQIMKRYHLITWKTQYQVILNLQPPTAPLKRVQLFWLLSTYLLLKLQEWPRLEYVLLPSLQRLVMHKSWPPPKMGPKSFPSYIAFSGLMRVIFSWRSSWRRNDVLALSYTQPSMDFHLRLVYAASVFPCQVRATTTVPLISLHFSWNLADEKLFQDARQSKESFEGVLSYLNKQTIFSLDYLSILESISILWEVLSALLIALYLLFIRLFITFSPSFLYQSRHCSDYISFPFKAREAKITFISLPFIPFGLFLKYMDSIVSSNLQSYQFFMICSLFEVNLLMSSFQIVRRFLKNFLCKKCLSYRRLVNCLNLAKEHPS